jgi:hypothetical protein
MKKIFTFLLITLLCVFSSFTFGGNITIYNPAAGVTWYSNTTYKITWTDNITQNVKIELIGTSGTYTITADTESDGEYDWTINPITLPGTMPGNYQIKITSVYNSNTTTTSSSFTINNVDPNKYIAIFSPAAGVTWMQNENYNLSWQDNIDENVKIELLGNGGPYLISASTESDGSFPWTGWLPTGVNTINYQLKITSVVNSNLTTTTPFTVTNINPNSIITIYNPAAGVNWIKNDTYDITWYDNIPGKVNIELLKSNGNSNGLIASNLDGNSYSWTIGEVSTNGYPKDFKIKIYSVDYPSISVISSIFTIFDKDPNEFITLWTPAAGVTWLQNENYNLTWSDNIDENVKIELLGSDGGTYIISNSTESDGTFPWVAWLPSGINTLQYQMKITSTTNSLIYVKSAPFTVTNINPNWLITCYNPAVGVIWVKGNTYNITWWDNITGDVKIELCNTDGTNIPGSGFLQVPESNRTCSWTIPSGYIGNYKIKISSVSNPSVYVLSGIFKITEYDIDKYITLWTPAAGVTWIKNESYILTWSDNFDENVKIELLGDGGPYLIDASTPSDGTYPWTAWLPADKNSLNYKLKISSVINPLVTVEGDFKVILDGKKSLNSNENKFAINIYPNPLTEKLNIISNQNMKYIWIMNSLGKLIYESPLNSEQTQIDVSSFNTGIYLIKIKNDTEIVNNKIMIQ